VLSISHYSRLPRLKTQKDGVANNTFWITTDGGRKLDLKRAELVAERVGDFVIYCTPNQHAVEAQEFQEGPIYLSNKEHDEYSVVSVVSEPNQKGFLLELASAMTGLGVTIHEAIIQVRSWSILHSNVVMALDMQTVHTSSSVEPLRHIMLILYFLSLLWQAQ
jgi:UTP:GlnB (protein PII) uridylyltransferase